MYCAHCSVCRKSTNVIVFHFRVKMTHFPSVALILGLSVTLIRAEYVKIGNIANLSPANISGHVYMKNENTIVIKDFKIKHGLAGGRPGYFLAGIKGILEYKLCMVPMALPVVEFSGQGYKIGKVFP